MAGVREIGVTKAKIKSVLSSGLGSMFDTVDSYFNDGITLNDINANAYYLSERAKYEYYPCIIIFGEETSHDPETGRYDLEHQAITIIAVETDTDEDTLVKRIERTIWAIARVLEANRTLTISGTNWADYLYVVGKSYSPVFYSRQSGVRGMDGQIMVEVRVSD